MTEEQVERVARAIYEVMPHYDLDQGFAVMSWDELVAFEEAAGYTPTITVLRDKARAAITAMQPLFMAEAGDVGEPVKITPVDDGWQDIASAPRDGTPLDLWVEFADGGLRWADGRWMEAGRHKCKGPANWCSAEGWPVHAYVDKTAKVTHWRPLPPPPGAKS